jgi:hypothetical protein
MPCWNGMCAAPECDGFHHVDRTGATWTQARGAIFCQLHVMYHHPDSCWWTAVVRENERWALYVRSGMTPAQFERAEAAGLI